eukprot:2977518-Pyramimonas_sp.AAC.1
MVVRPYIFILYVYHFTIHIIHIVDSRIVCLWRWHTRSAPEIDGTINFCLLSLGSPREQGRDPYSSDDPPEGKDPSLHASSGTFALSLAKNTNTHRITDWKSVRKEGYYDVYTMYCCV